LKIHVIFIFGGLIHELSLRDEKDGVTVVEWSQYLAVDQRFWVLKSQRPQATLDPGTITKIFGGLIHELSLRDEKDGVTVAEWSQYLAVDQRFWVLKSQHPQATLDPGTITKIFKK